MAYKHINSNGVTYYLNGRKVTLMGGKSQTIFYFSKDLKKATAVDLPSDRMVEEWSPQGFLRLRRKGEGQPDALSEEAGALERTPCDLALAIASEEAQLTLLPTEESEFFAAPDGEIYEISTIFSAALTGTEGCIERLERLIQASAPEAEFQRCLQECPELLRIFGHSNAVPHVVLEAEGGPLIPDFILRPVEHDLCDILEIKVPAMPLLTGSTRPQRSWALGRALSQLHQYAEALDDPRVQERVEERYKLQLFRPRLYLIAGRSQALDRRRLVRAMEDDYRTSVHTWDDVLLRARDIRH